MRKIEYIFIDSDRQTDGKSCRHALPNFGYHYVVNSQAHVINPTHVNIPVNLIKGPIYEPDKYNKCSICIRYCGSIRPEAWIIDDNASGRSILSQRATLIKLLVELRNCFPNAKILGVTELDGRELYNKNIIVCDAMNVLRRELSDYD